MPGFLKSKSKKSTDKKSFKQNKSFNQDLTDVLEQPSKKSSKQDKSNQSKKNFKVNERSTIKEPVQKSTNVIVDEEVVDLPVYSSSPVVDDDIDLFLVDVMTLSDREDLHPYFIGKFSTTPFDMYVKNSSVGIVPDDIVPDSSDTVVSMQRKSRGR